MRLGESDIEVLRLAALLHDIGKIGIRDAVLLKEGLFTPEERQEMNSHPVKTRGILEKFYFPRRLRSVSGDTFTAPPGCRCRSTPFHDGRSQGLPHPAPHPRTRERC